MIEVTTHIERLLLQHDCVIVPGLGGFVAQDCGACYVEEEGIFLPPYRSVCFNPSLTMNDGLLANEVAQQNGLTYADAVVAVAREAERIQQVIKGEGRYSVPGIGELKASATSTYDFTPLPCGIAAPSLYGLDCFYVTPTKEEPASTPVIKVDKPDADTFTLSIKMSAIRYAAAAAIAAVFFFVCLAPFSSNLRQKCNEACMLRDMWALFVPQHAQQPAQETVKPQQQAEPKTPKKQLAPTDHQQASPTAKENQPAKTTPQPAAVPTEKVAEVSKAPTAVAPQKPAVAEQAKAQSGQFTIVVSCAIPEANAEKLVGELKQAGLPQPRIIKDKKMLRVVFGSFASQDEARHALSICKPNCDLLDKAWFYKIP